MRCLECGTESAEPTDVCAWCGAPVDLQRPLAAAPAAGEPGSSITLPDAPLGATEEQTGSGSRRGAWILVGVTLAAIALTVGGAVALSSPSPRQLTWRQLQPGDCLAGSNLGLSGGGGWPDHVTAVACTKQHEAEVIFAGNNWPQSLAFPGVGALSNQAVPRCDFAFAAYDGKYPQQSIFKYTWISPDQSAWASGSRSLVCVAYEPSVSDPSGGTPVDYSIRRSGR